MDNPRAEKVAVVDEVQQRFGDADAAILTEYRGLKVKDLAGLRRTLRASGGEYKIYKNTLVRLAASRSGLSDLDELLVGPTAITFVKGDAAAVAKALRDFSRTNPLLVIKGGVLGDKIIGSRETAALAELPSREMLLARLAGLLAAPLQQLGGLMQALPRNLAFGLAALRDQQAAAQPGGAGEVGAGEPADATAGEPADADADAPAAATAGEPADADAGEPAAADAGAPAEATAGEPADADAGAPAAADAATPAEATAGELAEATAGAPADATAGAPADATAGAPADATAGEPTEAETTPSAE